MAARMGAWGSLADKIQRPDRRSSWRLSSIGGSAGETSVPAHLCAAQYNPTCMRTDSFQFSKMDAKNRASWPQHWNCRNSQRAVVLRSIGGAVKTCKIVPSSSFATWTFRLQQPLPLPRHIASVVRCNQGFKRSYAALVNCQSLINVIIMSPLHVLVSCCLYLACWFWNTLLSVCPCSPCSRGGSEQPGNFFVCLVHCACGV
jgi:hypothetical protein